VVKRTSGNATSDLVQRGLKNRKFNIIYSVRTSLSLAISGTVGKCKNRERATEHYKKIWTAPLNFNKCEQKCNASEKRDGNCHVFAIAAGQFYLHSYWLTAGIWAFLSGFPVPFKNFPEAAQYPSGIFQLLSYTLLAVPSGYTAFKSISKWLSAKTLQLRATFLLTTIKSRRNI
jgi:hypothetical protein